MNNLLFGTFLFVAAFVLLPEISGLSCYSCDSREDRTCTANDYSGPATHKKDCKDVPAVTHSGKRRRTIPADTCATVVVPAYGIVARGCASKEDASMPDTTIEGCTDGGIYNICLCKGDFCNDSV